MLRTLGLLYRPEIGAIVGAFLVTCAFSSITDAFLTVDNFITVLTISAELGVVVIGVAFLMISGEFNLSVGALFALAPLTVIALTNQGLDMTLSFIIAILLSALIGYICAVITLKTRIPSFITTLGVMFAIRGILLMVTEGFPLKYRGPPHYLMLTLGGKTPLGFRVSIIWFIILLVIFTIILELTPYGNHVFAVGRDVRVAEALGINAKRIKTINFVLSGILAGLGGCLTLDRLKMVDPLLGTGLELEAIAASVVGGCSLFGGYGSIIGAAIGAIIIAMVRCGLVLVGISAFWYTAFIGGILVIASLINKYVGDWILKRR
ncbi:MAG TPA: ABC transporter permease [Desulfurococcales archaeon]|nr:ABC transporter permease [Desulfurococcales archaeon]